MSEFSFPIFMRLARYRGAKQGFYVAAAPTPNPRPLTAGSYGADLPTVNFKLVVKIPSEVFDPAKWPVVEIRLDPGVRQIPIEVEVEVEPEPVA
jgi:hypothetical protein